MFPEKYDVEKQLIPYIVTAKSSTERNQPDQSHLRAQHQPIAIRIVQPAFSLAPGHGL